jgi:hypothetical protein
VGLIGIGFMWYGSVFPEFEFKEDYEYKMRFTYQGHNIQLYVVDDWLKFPHTCRDDRVVGCAVTTGMNEKYIILLSKDWGTGIVSYTDEWGYSTLYHEIKHITCNCNWHR